ncbi:MAG: hypothetical protein KF816_02185 [Melioribacteraceae bacterium]|nr:hypothetical protein [Melioribacteraceae bacterium]
MDNKRFQAGIISVIVRDVFASIEYGQTLGEVLRLVRISYPIWRHA